MRKRIITAVALVALAIPTAALAHVELRPGEVPAETPVAAEVVIEHGCAGADHDQGETSPTVEVALELDDRVSIEPLPVEGWFADTFADTVAWSAEGEGTAAEVVLPVRITLNAEVGETVDISVYQECANGDIIRWSAAEGEEGSRAMRVTAVAPDDEVPTQSSSGAATSQGATPSSDFTPSLSTDDIAGTDGLTDDQDQTPSPSGPATTASTPSGTSTPTGSLTATGSETAAVAEAGATGRDDDAPWWLWALGGVAVIGGLLALRRRGDTS